MATIIEHKKYCCIEVKNNHCKTWQYTLYDNGDLEVMWGRVGASLQKKIHPGGRHKLSGLISNKEGKGYKEVETIESGQVQTHSIAQNDLKHVATEQITHTSSEVKKLIEWLAEVNRHTILSHTNLTYNSASGLFSTPLGIVTPRSVRAARNFLATMQRYVVDGDFDNSRFIDALEEYLVLVPQKVGHARGWHRTFLTDVQAVRQQNDILDSLEASYRAVMSGQSSKDDAGADEPMEKVFDVKVDVLGDRDRITKELFDRYYKTRSTQHACYSFEPVKAYVVTIAGMHSTFEKQGKLLGNVTEMFHGTKCSSLLSVFKSGMIIMPSNSANITGRSYGDGIYGAPCHVKGSSTKALNYATTYWGGQDEGRYFVLVLDMAMGKIYIPKTDRWGDGGGPYPKPGYDSTWAKGGSSGVINDECIVYKTNQVDIKYLIEFRK